MTMGAAPSQGTTMGYVSDPFRTKNKAIRTPAEGSHGTR